MTCFICGKANTDPLVGAESPLCDEHTEEYLLKSVETMEEFLLRHGVKAKFTKKGWVKK